MAEIEGLLAWLESWGKESMQHREIKTYQNNFWALHVAVTTKVYVGLPFEVFRSIGFSVALPVSSSQLVELRLCHLSD